MAELDHNGLLVYLQHRSNILITVQLRFICFSFIR